MSLFPRVVCRATRESSFHVNGLPFAKCFESSFELSTPIGSHIRDWVIEGFAVNGKTNKQRQRLSVLGMMSGTSLDGIDAAVLDTDGVDIFDFGFLVDNFDPLGQNALPGWLQGNFDGDDDVDIGDFNQLVRNFSPLGYELTTATSVRMFGQVGVDDAAGIDSTDSDTSYVNNRRALHNDESQGVRHSTDDRYLVVDQYFRRARAKNIKLSENESSFIQSSINVL